LKKEKLKHIIINMEIKKNIQLKSKSEKPVLIDLYYKSDQIPKKVVIFCHGYKGFKDWGAWNLVAENFAKNDFFFIKMNFSHNGGTVDQPIDFPDLEAFGNNNFIKELYDLESVINWTIKNKEIRKEINSEDISLIGHSRGGAIVLIEASENKNISKVITWGGVSDFNARFPSGEVLQEWRKKGVVYIENARTKQKMPHYIQFYNSYKENENRLNIKNAVQNLNIPYLIIHGSNDETVLIGEADNLYSWNSNNQISIIENANHTFDSKHPWDSTNLPDNLNLTVNESVQFINS